MHTQEPWKYDISGDGWHGGLVDGEGFTIINSHAASWANAGTYAEDLARIVACVNACTGMTDPATEIEALRARVATLEAALQKVREHTRDYPATSEDAVAAVSHCDDIARAALQA